VIARFSSAILAAMRSSVFAAWPLLLACGTAEVQSQRLKDGSWTFTCELAMDECIRRVQEHCPAQRYRIIEGTSETRLRDAPPFERAYHTSRLHLKCNDAGADVLISTSGSTDSSLASVTAASKARACGVGETRACIGPAACQGGQACLPDGTGFGGCDCGSVAPPAAAPIAPEPAPAPPSSVAQPPSSGAAAVPAAPTKAP
jgi:hypothetical protein